jgi:S1-C subfamily serine protease
LLALVAAVAGAWSGGVESPAAAARVDVAHVGAVYLTVNRTYDAGVPVGNGFFGTMSEQDFGTGTILTGDGLVLTCHHVVEGATSISATDPMTGRHYAAQVLGYDIADEVALIRLVGATGLVPAHFGESRSVRVGDQATAIGNVGGAMELKAATGSILALNEAVATQSGGMIVQVQSTEDVAGAMIAGMATHGGDSGGPVFDHAHRVIGLVFAGNADDFFRDGRTLAALVPIDRALADAAQIRAGKTGGSVHAGPTAYLGTEVLYQYPDGHSCDDGQPPGGLTVPGDCVLASVPGSPAATAGLGYRDVITSIAGRPVRDHQDTKLILAGLAPGRPVRVTWVGSDELAHAATVVLASGRPL